MRTNRKFPDTWIKVCKKYQDIAQIHGHGYMTHIAEAADVSLSQMSNYMCNRVEPSYNRGIRLAEVIHKTSTEPEYMVSKDIYRLLAMAKSLYGFRWLKDVCEATGISKSKLSTNTKREVQISYPLKVMYRDAVLWTYDQLSSADRVVFDRAFPYWVVFQDKINNQ